MKKYLSNPATLNKLWVVLSAVILQAITLGLLDGPVASWATVIIGAVAAAGVFGVKNAPVNPDETPDI